MLLLLLASLLSAAPVPAADTLPRSFFRSIEDRVGPEKVIRLPLRARSIWNGELPRPANDGALWAGRGLSFAVEAGVGLRTGPMVVVLAPELLASRNRPFEVLAGKDSLRSRFSSPFHGVGPHSMDLPLRHGMEPTVRIHPGSSALWFESPEWGVRTGVTAAPLWWGPSLRNALLISHQAPGIPRAFASGLHATRWGTAEWQWWTGLLVESRFFDRDETNQRRSIGGIGVALSPAALPGWSFGGGRLVVAPELETQGFDAGALLESAFRSASLWGEGGAAPEADALSMLFVAWEDRARGLRVSAEGAWQELPGGLRDWLTAWSHTRATTVALEWAPPAGSPSEGWYVAAEAASLDQTRVKYGEPAPPDFYSGRADPAGFTHHGQLLGAPAGPGGQEVWIEAGRRAGPVERAGLYLSRARIENDAVAREPALNFSRRDAALEGGVRVRGAWRGVRMEAEAGVQRRFNYLFQNGRANPLGLRTVNVTNPHLSLGVEWAW